MFFLTIFPFFSHITKTTRYEDPRTDLAEESPQPRLVTLKRHPELGFGFVAGSEKPVIVRWEFEFNALSELTLGTLLSYGEKNHVVNIKNVSSENRFQCSSNRMLCNLYVRYRKEPDTIGSTAVTTLVEGSFYTSSEHFLSRWWKNQNLQNSLGDRSEFSVPHTSAQRILTTVILLREIMLSVDDSVVTNPCRLQRLAVIPID